MSRNLMQRLCVAVEIKRERRLRMAEPARELHRDDALLMPQRSSAMTEQVWMDRARIGQLPPHRDPRHSERNALGERLGHERDARDKPTRSLPLHGLSAEAHALGLDVVWTQAQGLRDPASELLHRDRSEQDVGVERAEEREHIGRVRWIDLVAHDARQLDAARARDVLAVCEVEDHPKLADIADDRARFEFVGERSDPRDHVGDGEFVDYRGPEVPVDALLPRAVARERRVRDASLTGEPFGLKIGHSERGGDGAVEFGLRVQTGGEPLGDPILSRVRILARAECPAMLKWRVAATAPVLHIEAPSTARQAPSSHVQGCQGVPNLPHVHPRCIIARTNVPTCRGGNKFVKSEGGSVGRAVGLCGGGWRVVPLGIEGVRQGCVMGDVA